MAVRDDQPTLFALPPRVIEAAPIDPAQRALASTLSPELRMGTMSWSFAGWRGLLYAKDAEPKLLSEAGLTAYCEHPLLRTVEI